MSISDAFKSFSSSSSRQPTARNAPVKNYSEVIEDDDSDVEEVSFTPRPSSEARRMNLTLSRVQLGLPEEIEDKRLIEDSCTLFPKNYNIGRAEEDILCFALATVYHWY
ncbi:hypothetical protein FKM82_009800 [Ascaphus truei]